MKHLLYYLLTAVTITLASCGHEQEPQVTPSGRIIKVGIIAPFSGMDSAKGEEGLKGINTVTQIIPLLKNGDRIRLIVKNDRNEPENAVKALMELVENDQVSAVLTLSGSSSVLAMAGLADTLKTPIIAALATHPGVTEGNRYVSQICFDNIFQGNVAALFVRDELLMDRVAIFYSSDSFYSKNLAEEFKRKFTDLGGQVTDMVDYPDNTPGNTNDASGILKNVRAKNPELLYMPLTAGNVITIIEGIKKTGWDPGLMASDGLLATVVSQYKDKLSLLNGLLATDFFHYTSRGTGFGERLAEKYEGRATSYTAMGAESFALLLDAMNRCIDPADRSCINYQIRATANFEGLLGNISIGLNGKARRPVVINAIRDNRLKYIVKVY